VVKLLDTLLQNLSQMRTLSIVDESPDFASAVEARISVTKTRRYICLFLFFVESMTDYMPAGAYTWPDVTLHLEDMPRL
jgi:hypothetical protein